VSRDAVHVEELKGSDAQGECDGGGEALVRTLKMAVDTGVEGNLPAEDAHDEGGCKVAVLRRERLGASGVEEFVGVALAISDKGKDLKSNAAGGGHFRRAIAFGDVGIRLMNRLGERL
jgi:hypothetical protein